MPVPHSRRPSPPLGPTIVDCHCHAGPGDGLSGPWDSDAHLRSYIRAAREAGIARTVLFPVFHSDYAHANRAVARIVAAERDRFFGFAFVHPVRDRGRVGELIAEAVQAHGFRGIKVHRHDAPISAEICEVARAWGLPVLYDVMGEVAQVELLARQYPQVPFIIPHLGSFSDDWRAQLALIDHLIRHPNVYTDTSGVRRFDILRQAVRRAGPDKILFGSDGPWLHPGLELRKIGLLHLTRGASAKITGGNLLGLISEPARRRRAQGRTLIRVGRPKHASESSDPWQAKQSASGIP
jgi:predicted TIM-barrel fold metal-dependent hydrolase